jgi:RNA polymerase sigma-70 factor (ECF subfamily)
MDWIDDFESTFRTQYGRLVRALTVVAGNREAAHDAVQDAFVKAYLRWRRVSQYEDPVGWVRRVAINSLKDEHRRAANKLRVIDRLGGRFEESTDGEPVIDEMDDLLAQLPRQQRVCVALYYIEQLSVAEIARSLDLSDGAVQFHLYRGRERLRGVLVGARAS